MPQVDAVVRRKVERAEIKTEPFPHLVVPERETIRMTYQAHILPKHDVRPEAESFVAGLADPAARKRWERYVERRRARAAEKAQASPQ